MNFQMKNFKYVTKGFGEFVDDIVAGERMYLRSLSSKEPTKASASFWSDYPSIAEDFRLPAELQFAIDNCHSSILRISGPVSNVVFWLSHG